MLGWREFMRHVYRRTMPELADGDLLERSRDLPPLYYDSETEMRCLDEAEWAAIRDRAARVRERATEGSL